MEINKAMQCLMQIYGGNVFEDMMKVIMELRDNSNIPFDEKYVRLSLEFCAGKAEQITNGEREKCSLRELVSESFGEATMYKYNCCNRRDIEEEEEENNVSKLRKIQQFR